MSPREWRTVFNVQKPTSSIFSSTPCADFSCVVLETSDPFWILLLDIRISVSWPGLAMVFYPWSHLPCCSVSCPPVSRLGHYPEAGAHFVNTGVQGDTMHPDSHTSGFSWLYLLFIVPVSRYHLPRSDLGTGKASDRCNSTSLEN